jgi:hypothetical protein
MTTSLRDQVSTLILYTIVYLLPNMLTLVWSTAGSIQQVQVGAADIVATLSGMPDIWGWIGGLSGFRHMLANIPNPFGKTEFQVSELILKVQPATCYSFTSSGVISYRDETTFDAFSGNGGLALHYQSLEARQPQ